MRIGGQAMMVALAVNAGACTAWADLERFKSADGGVGGGGDDGRVDVAVRLSGYNGPHKSVPFTVRLVRAPDEDKSTEVNLLALATFDPLGDFPALRFIWPNALADTDGVLIQYFADANSDGQPDFGSPPPDHQWSYSLESDGLHRRTHDTDFSDISPAAYTVQMLEGFSYAIRGLPERLRDQALLGRVLEVRVVRTSDQATIGVHRNALEPGEIGAGERVAGGLSGIIEPGETYTVQMFVTNAEQQYPDFGVALTETAEADGLQIDYAFSVTDFSDIGVQDAPSGL